MVKGGKYASSILQVCFKCVYSSLKEYLKNSLSGLQQVSSMLFDQVYDGFCEVSRVLFGWSFFRNYPRTVYWMV